MSKMSPFPFPKQLNVKEALLCTFAYFDLFKRPLTRDEITKFFLFEEPDEAKIDIYLKESPLIFKQDGLFSLDPAHFNEHTFKTERAAKYWKKIHRWRFLFEICPFIKSVMVCNSLPIEDIDKNSDIDLFIITEKNRLFLARFWLTLLVSFFGLRRHGKKVKKRFCLSFYISEDELSLEEIVQEPYDIYLAYWVKTLEPVSGEFSIYEKFMEKNEAWLFPYFASFTRNRRYFRNGNSLARFIQNSLKMISNSDSYERKCQNRQLKRIHQKLKKLSDKSGTVVNEKILKFHDHDARSLIRQKWVQRVNELL